jgi:hypothetical protein
MMQMAAEKCNIFMLMNWVKNLGAPQNELSPQGYVECEGVQYER